ncbi:conserved hypothetical protein [Ricinus communis]|uniref:Uncharacterized protein n=1 Tax=Ricinus communis TaxID=3988 RepID=B9T1Z8_RICCO|nr:conserved hypothetical protein [Ricinus communis]
MMMKKKKKCKIEIPKRRVQVRWYGQSRGMWRRRVKAWEEEEEEEECPSDLTFLGVASL